MVLVYLVIGILFIPCVMLRLRTEENAQLFDKSDTVAIRGISALFVMIAHYSNWFNQISNVTINRILMMPLEQLGGIGVLLFFFVSGYGINESYGKKNDMKGFVIKRFYGVYLPYVLMKIITNTMLNVAIGFPSLEKSIESYLLILLVPDWFIFVIILQYLSYYASKTVFAKFDLVFSLLSDIVMTVIFILLNKPIGWFNALWLFTFGIILSKYQKWMLLQIRRNYYLILVGSLLGFMLFGGIFAIYKGQAWANIAKPTAGFLLCIALCCLFRKIKYTNRITLWFGRCSMYLYIVHIAVWDISLCMSIHPISSFGCSVIASIFVTGCIHYLVTCLIKKIKA